MDTLWHEVWKGIKTDFSDLPGIMEVTQLLLRLGLAAGLGGLLGFQREWVGRAAGLRTHMLVALGSALFVLISMQAGMSLVELSRILQGLTAGIGFLGAGTILKRGAQIEGLTTAASLWLTAAVGVAAGMGREMSAVLGTVLAFIILALVPQMRSKGRSKGGRPPRPEGRGFHAPGWLRCGPCGATSFPPRPQGAGFSEDLDDV